VGIKRLAASLAKLEIIP